MMDDASLKNPRETAGFFSLLTFSWLNNVLKFGSQHPLEEKHLFPIETSVQTEKLVGDLEREWLAEERASERAGTNPRLWRAMMKIISYRDYITVGLLRCFYSITANLVPLTVWFFLKSMSSVSDTSYTSSLTFVICVSVVCIIRTLLINQCMIEAEMSGIRLKVATIGLVYKKVCNDMNFFRNLNNMTFPSGNTLHLI